MSIDFTLTLHAQDRLTQRSRETSESLLKIISEERYFNIGKECGSNREHFLFFSKLDWVWHVLIADIKTKQVITILPIDFHENISWKISYEVLEAAKQIALNDRNIDACDENSPSTFKIKASYSVRQNYFKWINLGSWPYSHESHLNEFIPQKDFWSFIELKIQEKNKLLQTLDSIIISRGKNSVDRFELTLPKNLDN